MIFKSGFFLLFALFATSVFADAKLAEMSPVLIVQETNGEPFDISKLRGKVVIVHFWATWCTVCREEMAVLDAFYRHNHEKGVEMLAVSIERTNKRGKIQEIMRDFSYPAALLVDAQANGFDTPKALPLTYIIDKQGMIRHILTPETEKMTGHGLDEIVQPLLK